MSLKIYNWLVHPKLNKISSSFFQHLRKDKDSPFLDLWEESVPSAETFLSRQRLHQKQSQDWNKAPLLESFASMQERSSVTI